MPAKPEDVLELDELWSFVRFRKNKRWVWLAQCRRTRQIVAYAIGQRDEATCRLLWQRIPQAYKHSLCYTDFWSAYADVLPPSQHRATGKGDGQTCHADLPYRALQRHPAAKIGPLRQENAVVLEDRPDARNVSAPVLARTQQTHQTEDTQLNVYHYPR